ncbi:MAG: hypothetical protein ACE5JZ_13640 [Kiloniellales bacterium]
MPGFGFQESALGGKLVRTNGLARAKTKIGMMNPADNMRRMVWPTEHSAVVASRAPPLIPYAIKRAEAKASRQSALSTEGHRSALGLPHVRKARLL